LAARDGDHLIAASHKETSDDHAHRYDCGDCQNFVAHSALSPVASIVGMLGGKHPRRTDLALRDALIEHLKRDIASFRQGIKMMEVGILTTGELDRGWLLDKTKETLESYRHTVADLERQLESIKTEDQ